MNNCHTKLNTFYLQNKSFYAFLCGTMQIFTLKALSEEYSHA